MEVDICGFAVRYFQCFKNEILVFTRICKQTVVFADGLGVWYEVHQKIMPGFSGNKKGELFILGGGISSILEASDPLSSASNTLLIGGM